MPEAYIIDAVRTPVGKRGGALAGMHSADLGAHALSALMARTGVDPGADGLAALAREAARLTAWLDGVQITNVYTSRLMKGERLP